jgi:hypothetical protein
MNIKTPEQNGAGDRSLAQTAAQNLTLQQNVVRSHPGVEPLPGYVLAAFEKRGKGGAIFSRLVNPGERPPAIFRIPFLDWAQRYLSIAVNDSVLSYAFSHSITLDDGSDEFTLDFHLTYRVANPQKVAEIWEQDPLRQLRDEIARVIGRSCAKRKAEKFRTEFRDIERAVIDAESVRLRPYAAELGLKIISIELNKRLPEYKRKVIDERKKAEAEKDSFAIQHGVDRVKQRASRAWDYEVKKEDVDHKYDIEQLELERQIGISSKLDEVHRAEQNRKLRGIQTDAIAQALTNVGAGINTPWDLRDGFEVAREIGRGIQADTAASSLSTGLPPKSGVLEIGSGEDRLSSWLSQGVQEVDRWNCTPAQKQALRSTLLHIVAEALLDDHADETILKQYANKLSELGRGFEFPLNRSQRDFLGQFIDFNALRNKLR